MRTCISRELPVILPRLRRFAYGLTGDSELADDLVQTACERALNRKNKWQERDAIDHWLFRTIRNLFIDHIRHQRVVDNHSRVAQSEPPSVVNGEAVMETEFLLDEIQLAINELSEDHRSIILLVCAEGFSYQEVASILELPIGTVTSRLARARARIIELINLSRPVTAE